MSTTIAILNLKCGGCANTIKKGLLSVAGVNDVIINIETSRVTVNSESESVLQDVKVKLSKLGYPQTGDKNTMMYKAKSFVSCATGRISEKV